jgi:hypothetical protein
MKKEWRSFPVIIRFVVPKAQDANAGMMNRPREMKELIIDFESDDVARQILEAIKNRARH